ncbi:MAG: hypothetical protein WD042_03145 [Phycisphaeraceae bacterium]
MPLANLYNNAIAPILEGLEPWGHQYPGLHGPFLLGNVCMGQSPLMIVGQETGGWDAYQQGWANQPQPAIAQLMATYNALRPNGQVGGQWANTPFWWMCNAVSNHLVGNDAFIWNNLWKFDNNGHALPDDLRDGVLLPWMIQHQVLLTEIALTGAKRVLFVTGPASHAALQHLGLHVNPVNGGHALNLYHVMGDGLPDWAYVTYHPNYLNFQGLGQQFIQTLGAL